MRFYGRTSGVFLGLLIFLAALGCGSVSDLSPGAPGSLTRVYPGYTYKQVWDAAVGAVVKNFDLTEHDPSRGVLRGNLSTWDRDQGVAIFVTDLGKEGIRVEVVSRSPHWPKDDWNLRLVKDLENMLPSEKGGLKDLVLDQGNPCPAA